MPQNSPYLPDTADRQLVRFHCDYGSPGGFVGTICEDPDPEADPGYGVWMFYADQHLIAQATKSDAGWVVDVKDPEFVASQQITSGALERLFERGSTAPDGPYEVFVPPVDLRHGPPQPQTARPSLALKKTGPKPNDLVAAPHNGFRLDRSLLAESVDAVDEENTDGGIHRFSDIPAERIAAAVTHAIACKALIGPEHVVLTVLKVTQRPDTVVLAIHEGQDAATRQVTEREQAGLRAERQVTSWPLEPHDLSDPNDRTFGGLCLTLEYVCGQANTLLGSLQALLDGEAMLLEAIDAPFTILTYNTRGRLASYRANVGDATEGDPDQAKTVWPLLIETLERGEAQEDWDGDRQRAFHLQPGSEPHLAGQLVALRDTLIAEGKATAGDLPDPTGGFAASGS